MARHCAICGKKSTLVWRRVRLRAEKFNPTIKRRQYPNLQWASVPLEIKRSSYRKFAGRRILACAKCIKTLGKRK